ncbi:putative ribosome biogenesis GTPase RsgA [Clavibacter michiganensis]|uniref:Ribosome small subunit-dependent GTPase A n=1 Tax=Clavibacter capsici TaxID=1874630 RepID=A0AAE6XPX6_9MICO|nr:ribosome small subunit-dependent GTPase A [Clavibacter capsici]ALD12564.1 GTPase [Clavibacter capsici]OUE29566.1 putative ribosome biogenesis GTPase RsgA [Clavibacter michiganensis]QIS44710.1 ribosome small subunit-dependent GTPase A [Clavibacter capsici]
MSWLADPEEDDGVWDAYDESSVRVRPNPKGNKPRSKQRPGHTDAVEGRVLTVDRGRFGVLVGEDTPDEHTLTATRARELGKKAVVTNDRVDIVGDTSGDEGSLSRIVRIAPRRTLLRRSADDSDAVERVIVANADQMLIVVAAAEPEPRARLVDRYLVAAFDAGIQPILCITKSDVADPAPFAAHFRVLDVPIVLSRSDDVPLEELRALLADRTTVAVGHSGVGKSTLVNALVPDAKRATGVVNQVTGRGRHTSSSTVSMRVETGDGGHGWIIDTPGVRSFGLGHVDPANILRSFASYAHLPEGEPPGGIPLTEAHDWEIVDRVEAGELGDAGRERLHSLQHLVANRSDAAKGDQADR